MDPFIWMHFGGANELPSHQTPCELLAMKPAGAHIGLAATSVVVTLLVAALALHFCVGAPAGHAAGTLKQSSAANAVTVSNGM